MTVTLGRRELLVALGGAAAWPLAVRAQQAGMPVIGFLNGGVEGPHYLNGFRQGLKTVGYVEGQNVAIEYRGRRAGTIDYRRWQRTLSAAK